ncbi:hypothetical protein GCM10010218_61360 [Streptomyces mashuensis]|uniref:DUF1440 domain-containing protein n=1 Tax=Streptomyces mashuensis TaxID=33904 RepID=A0A919BAJ0_9ACTN|nr:hypothetical protein [Streptomyces mashuensis]GHF71850.1 hypothetical protein GCM10010218_61360 [Streptomyces mashuensis]
MVRPGRLAADAGVGLAAGLAGTLAMTVSSTVEMRLRGREAGSAPADAAGKVLGVEPVDEAGAARFSRAVHYGYGTGWGAVRGVLAGLGLRPVAATAVHLGLVWGGELVTLPALGVAPPVTRWRPPEVAADAWHHLVYAVTTGIAYVLLDRDR